MFIAIVIAVATLVLYLAVKQAGGRGITRVSAAGAQEMLRWAGVTVLDVRTPQEFSAGHIQGAMLLPVDELPRRIAELFPAKQKKILVYCRAGSRSAAASRVLRKNGFEQVADLQGGIMDWMGNGFPTVKGG